MKKLLFLLLLLVGGFSLPPVQSAEPVPFNGLIVDQTGKGIKARITVKSDERYTIANKRGEFGLTDVAPTDTLVVTYKRVSQEIPVAGRRSLRIRWIAEGPEYEEDEGLVDSGFGYIKRREYTGNSSRLSGEEMVRRGYTDLQSAILGLIPSVQLHGGQIIIRGIGSVNSNNAALILCDGVEVRSLNSINIRDVVSVEVQKGSNMYGLRGGNGVILIRTRK